MYIDIIITSNQPAGRKSKRPLHSSLPLYRIKTRRQNYPQIASLPAKLLIAPFRRKSELHGPSTLLTHATSPSKPRGDALGVSGDLNCIIEGSRCRSSFGRWFASCCSLGSLRCRPRDCRCSARSLSPRRSGRTGR